MTNDFMVEFRINNGGSPGEKCLLRISQIVCLFPEHHHIRTLEHSWTITVFAEDWPKVEKAFRAAYLGNRVKAMEEG